MCLFTRPAPATLADRYRPATLAEVLGQPAAVAALSSFAAAPFPSAWLFSGPTGTGKTCAARALALDLGIDPDAGEWGGFHSIASGEQTGESVRSACAALRCHPPASRDGWRMLLVNECDRMSDAAAFIWLDALESLPGRSVVVFTTNDPQKLPQRLRDRCEGVEFAGDALALRPAAQALVNRVWAAEHPDSDPPALAALKGAVDRAGLLSFRRVLQLLAPAVRSGITPRVDPVDVPDPAPKSHPAPRPAPTKPAPLNYDDPAERRRVIAECRARMAAATRPQPVGV